MRSTYWKMASVFVAALALCVLTAASASAAQLYVNGKAATASEKLSTTVKSEESAVVTFLYNNKEPTAYLQVTCPSISGKYLESISTAGTITTSKIAGLELVGCKVTKPTEESCEFREGPTENQFTYSLEGKLALGSKSPEDTAEFAATKPSTWMLVALRENGCPALIGLGPYEWEVHGKLKVKIPTGQKESVEQQVVFEAIEGLYGFNTLQPVHFTTKFKVKLASGEPWSFH